MSLPTELLPDPLPPEPLHVFHDWVAYAMQRRDQPNPNAMVLATADADGRPSARVVLCKQIVPAPGYVVFYTNYQSRKGSELAANQRAAIVMHWDHLHRQVRVEGVVVRSPPSESDAYFASRPWQSRLGAWASAQSQPVSSRSALREGLESTARRFGTPSPTESENGGPQVSSLINADTQLPGTPAEGARPFAAGSPLPTAADFPVPRPPHWGGFRLWADAVELWVEGEARIHDRARWTRKLTPKDDGLFDVGPWAVSRLQP
jgi:pyridoxamine 5'-phosphate oxidase